MRFSCVFVVYTGFKQYKRYKTMKFTMKKIAKAFACAAVAATVASFSTASAIENKDIKIGVSIWSSTDVLGSCCKRVLDAAANALGVQVQYVDQAHVSEKVTASVEQLVAAGCQGIIICNSSDTEMTSAIKTANDNKVYLTQFFRIISKQNSPAIYKMATKSDYYIGAVHENEPENGAKLVQILLDKGCRNIGLIGWEQGDATWLGRWAGYKAGVEQWNKDHPNDKATLSEPQYAGTSSEGGSKAAEALMAANPKLDALIPAGGGGDPLQGAIAAVERAGKTGQIKIVSTDFLPDLGERLKNGSMAGQSGGHYCDPLFAFMMTYNAIKGNYKDFGGKFEDVTFPYLYVSSPDDYADYEKYFVDKLPYTDKEFVEMSKLDLEGLKATAAKLSIQGGFFFFFSQKILVVAVKLLKVILEISMLTSAIRNQLLVDEMQLGTRLCEDVHNQNFADFSLLLSMLSHDMMDNPLFNIEERIQKEEDLRKKFSLLPEPKKYADHEAFQRADSVTDAFAEDGLRQVFLAECLHKEPLTPFERTYAPEVFAQLTPLKQEKLRREMKGVALGYEKIHENGDGFEVLSEISESRLQQDSLNVTV